MKLALILAAAWIAPRLYRPRPAGRTVVWRDLDGSLWNAPGHFFGWWTSVAEGTPYRNR